MILNFITKVKIIQTSKKLYLSITLVDDKLKNFVKTCLIFVNSSYSFIKIHYVLTWYKQTKKHVVLEKKALQKFFTVSCIQNKEID